MTGFSVDSDFKKQFMGEFRLTTAEILYHMPDCHGLLQTYVWQDYDIAPRYPILGKFLQFWTDELEGPLHSVTVGAQELIAPSQASHRDFEFKLH
jgi:uncharacterized protein Usg